MDQHRDSVGETPDTLDQHLESAPPTPDAGQDKTTPCPRLSFLTGVNCDPSFNEIGDGYITVAGQMSSLTQLIPTEADLCNFLLERGVRGRQTRNIDPVLAKCWASVVDGAPALRQHWCCWFETL